MYAEHGIIVLLNVEPDGDILELVLPRNACLPVKGQQVVIVLLHLEHSVPTELQLGSLLQAEHED